MALMFATNAYVFTVKNSTLEGKIAIVLILVTAAIVIWIALAKRN